MRVTLQGAVRRFLLLKRFLSCAARKLFRLELRVHFQLAWRLGDEISSLPVYEAAKTAYPNSRISVTVQYPELLYGNPYVHDINTARVSPDIVHDIRRTDPAARRYEYLSGVLSFPIVNTQPRLYGVRLAEDAVIDTWARQHTAAVKVCVCAESSWSCKNWPLERYRAVCAQMAAEHHAAVVQVGLTEKMNIGGLDLVGKTADLHRIIYLMSKVDMFLGNDTALLHLALAMNVCSVGIFGPVLPETIMTPKNNCICVQRRDLPCIGCWSRRLMRTPGVCPMREPYCMTQLSVDAVHSAVGEAFASLTEAKLRHTR